MAREAVWTARYVELFSGDVPNPGHTAIVAPAELPADSTVIRVLGSFQLTGSVGGFTQSFPMVRFGIVHGTEPDGTEWTNPGIGTTDWLWIGGEPATSDVLEQNQRLRTDASGPLTRVNTKAARRLTSTAGIWASWAWTVGTAFSGPALFAQFRVLYLLPA